MDEVNTFLRRRYSAAQCEKTLSSARCQMAKREINHHSAENRADDDILEETPASFYHCPLAGEND